MNNTEKNKKLGEEFLRSMTNSAENFKKWIRTSQFFMNKTSNNKKIIGAYGLLIGFLLVFIAMAIAFYGVWFK